MNFIKKIYYQKYSKKSYSISNVDLIIDRLFRNNKKGIYLDIGCNHPIKHNNTYLLYERGWNGINIDLDKTSIDEFKKLRPKDINIQIGVSNYAGNKKVFYYHKRSPLNTLSKKLKEYRIKKPTKTFNLQVDTLNNIIKKSKFKNKQINLMSIDIENHEYEALQNFNFKKYKIDLIVTEFTNLSGKKIETYNLSISDIFKSKIYKLLIKNNYRLINWVNSDLIFANKNSKILND
tara:strand:+ start:625 stop:1326 length:702 start_codon:yes stop_codon:yes gene_type:complete